MRQRRDRTPLPLANRRRLYFSRLVRAGALAVLLAPVLAPAWQAAAETGLPIPRFVSLRANEVNVRTGPGRRYPILWVFKRRGMPVEVIAEFDNWRKIRDWEGEEGWLHHSTLSGHRSALVVGEMRILRRNPSDDAPAVAHAEPGVIGRLIECNPQWCRLDVLGYRGWLRRAEIWGVYKDEVLE